MSNRIRQFVRILSSLQLTIVCLAISMILVFFGTLAQVHMGINGALKTYFHSVIVWWTFPDIGWTIPILPGGYLVGTVLLFNLIAAHLTRFRWTWRKSGIFLTHLGVIFLLVGELLTSIFSRENHMVLNVGQTAHYIEAYHGTELAVIDTSDPKVDHVVAIPEARLNNGATIKSPALPFKVKVIYFYGNSELFKRPADQKDSPDIATRGVGKKIVVRQIPRTGKMNQEDDSSALIEPIGKDGPLGTWLVSTDLAKPQGFDYNGRHYTLTLRLRRTYEPFAITLKHFTHDVYPGTNIPKNFASHIILRDPQQGIDRKVKIWMNHPLRYAGLTFYQASFANEDRTSILQVVRNPSSLLPYIACTLVAVGLLIQFGMHLFGFVRKRKA